VVPDDSDSMDGLPPFGSFARMLDGKIIQFQSTSQLRPQPSQARQEQAARSGDTNTMRPIEM
jgi:hypothetical protein